ncbi:transglutaminase domain-containing protein [Actinomadura sp. NAK00032]|uniref:transglutaminase-like domain-containing protein n=1 Tax=Actinomadura sp. NAK00032 TaxID=2742128 RepID=UPI0015925255|nr:transglutaminase-like domain-containing protein [Actinomadura sp. NAK00032]QKW33520.1 transglutaminase domain-containing protein [Actinomadura sp. NAK00032]
MDAVNRGRALLAAAAVTLAAAASSPLLAAGYERPAPVAAVLACTAIAAVAVTSAAHRLLRGLGPIAVLAGLPVAAIGLVVVAARAPGPVREPVPGAVDALLHSGARILTTAPHPPATVDLLAFPLLAVWLAGAIATVLRRDGRVLPALLPGAVLLAGAAALNPETAGAGYWSAALLAGAAALVLASAPPDAPDSAAAGFTVQVRAPEAARARRRPLPRVAAAGTAVACAVALPGIGAAVAAPGMLESWPVRASDPRRQGELPDKPREVRNPMAYLSEWSAAPDLPLMTVSGGRTPLRWVALAEFTGTMWIPDATYTPAGPTLPPAETVPPRTTRSTVQVKVQNLPGDWLPVPGIPTRVDGMAVGHDAGSGTLLSLNGPVAGHSYTASGTVPDWTGWRGTDAMAASGTGFERYLRLPPGAPARLDEIARKAAGDGGPHQRASRIAEYLRDSYTFRPGVPGGHGYARLGKLLVPPGRRGGGATSEQFASAFAVLARAAGLPSRVVVGFGPAHDGTTVRSGDAVAWGEIYYEGVGWVSYDPNPRKRSAAAPTPRPGDRTTDDGTYRDDGAGDQAGTGARGGEAPPGDGGGYAVLAVPPLVLLLLFLTMVPLLRLRAQRRSLQGAARERILSAWTELLVAMRLAGLTLPASATTADVSALLAARLPGTAPGPLRRLAAQVDAAGFGGPVTRQDAAFASAQVRALAAGLRRSSSPLRRLAWWSDPRAPLWSARPSRLTRRARTGRGK